MGVNHRRNRRRWIALRARIADGKGYESNRILTFIRSGGATEAIPAKRKTMQSLSV